MQNLKLFLMILAIAFFGMVFYFLRQGPGIKTTPSSPPKPTPSQTNQNDPPKIVATKPDPLEGAVISATEVLEITFNRSLENVPEFKSRIDPKIDYKIELSSDRKTARIVTKKPYELGTSYTLFILPDSKFEGGGKLDGEKIFHFHTIRYRGV